MKIAYLGPPGTFSEEAAIAWGGADADLMPFPSFPAAAEAVERGEADVALLPIENSIEGGVTVTMDLLIHQTPLRIRGELVVPVRHFLAAKPGVRLEDVKVIVSHPQPLGQCRQWLRAHLPGAEQVAALSTAASVREAVEAPGMDTVGIGTRRAAELYGAAILAEDIQDDDSNMTRFIALAHADAPPTGDDKTSLGFTTHVNVPGSLHGVLTVFADAGLQLVRIESRPVKHTLGEYVFLVDLEGHRLDPVLAGALERARERCLTFDVYGSYPRFPLETLRERMAGPDRSRLRPRGADAS